ncbi:unnamed protein product, partial [Chrysoparadoxa australica]
DYLPPRQESAVDNRGIKTVVEWKLNDKGQKLKTTTKVKVFSDQQRTAKACFERKKWAKFGGAAGLAPEENSSYTIISLEEIKMETPQQSKQADLEPNNLDENLKMAMEKVRRRNAMRSQGLLGPGDAGPDENEGEGLGLRRGMGGLGGEAKYELFGAFGRIHRVYLAKDPVTMQSRGFAFVSFTSEQDAARAMAELQGYGYDHLILMLEYAKPSQRDLSGGGGGSGLAGMRTSGYGQALAQDTKEKISYASNLTR